MQVSFNALNADYLLQDFHVYRRSDQYSGLTSSFWKVALIVWSKMEISTSGLPKSGFSTQLKTKPSTNILNLLDKSNGTCGVL